MKPCRFFYLLIFLAFFSSVYANEPHVRIIQVTGSYDSDEGELFFHGDDVADVNDGEEWVAVIQNTKGYTTKKTKVFVETVMDDIGDEPTGPFTGKKISIELKKTADIVFLVSGLDLRPDVQIPFVKTIKTPGPAESYSELNLEAGSSIEIKGLKRNLILKGMDTVYREVYETGYERTIMAYKLVGIVDDYQFTVMKESLLDDATPHIIWAGDLNQDGYPDFLIDISPKYSMTKPALFLSQIKKGKLSYKKMAERTSYGC